MKGDTLMDLVSIVIPTHKGAKTICRAVDSALAQDYPNIEVIVVDDNGIGTPGQIQTEQAMKKYQGREKVTYIKHRVNVNGSAARNTGVKATKGTYIAFLDDDDIFLPHKTRLQIEALSRETEDYAVCYTSYDNVFEDGRRRVTKAGKKGDLCYPLLSMQVSILSSVMLIHRKAWEYAGGFDESFKRDQDQEFCVRVFRKYKAAVVPDVCTVRHILKRNAPSDVQKSVAHREYYIYKMKPIIETFSHQEQKAIYSANYTEIAKRYFKARKPLKCLAYIMKSGTPVAAAKKLVRSFFTYRSNVKENLNQGMAARG